MKKKSKNTNNKNIMRVIKISTIILSIILISMVSFFGIYTQNKGQISNKVKDYNYAMDIKGARTIELELNDKISDELKTEKNYIKVKSIIEKRLKSIGVQNYNISLDETTGKVIIQIPEDDITDYAVSTSSTVGNFKIIDSETKEVLLDNSHIKSSDVLYSTTETGTAVFLEIAFNKEGKAKLEEISKTYVVAEEESKNEETLNEVENQIVEENVEGEVQDEKSEETTKEKTITLKVDDEEIMTTSFEEPITNGAIQLTVGGVTTNSATLQEYIDQGQNMATILDNGNLPLEYKLVRNQFILSDITEQDLMYIAIVIAVVVFIGIIILTMKYKTNGLVAGISYIGLAALYLLLIRYANIVISIESIFGIIIMLILNYIFTIMLLENIKDKKINKATIETYKKFFSRITPICIMVIVFCFVRWIPISSFGMISFWGLVLIAAYNAVITRLLLKVKVEEK